MDDLLVNDGGRLQPLQALAASVARRLVKAVLQQRLRVFVNFFWRDAAWRGFISRE
jgi:hypothetical protein